MKKYSTMDNWAEFLKRQAKEYQATILDTGVLSLSDALQQVREKIALILHSA